MARCWDCGDVIWQQGGTCKRCETLENRHRREWLRDAEKSQRRIDWLDSRNHEVDNDE